MKNYRKIFMGMLLAVTLLVTACGGSSKYESAATESNAEAPAEAYDMAVTEEAVEMEAGGAVTTGADISKTAQANRKLIRTFEMHIQTKEFDSVLNGIQTKVQELGGYIENSSLDGGSAYYHNYNRYSNMTVRIPSDQLDGFVETVKETANVTYISESTDDVTLQYVDVESRKIALETERDRLLELLEKAETVEDIITIESRLSEVRYQLESYTSQLRTLDNQVDYSTVHISIDEVDRETKVEPKTFWEEVTSEFSDSLYDLGRDFRDLAIWFLGSSPYLVIWAIAIAAIVFVLKAFHKKKAFKLSLKKTKIEIPEEKEQ